MPNTLDYAIVVGVEYYNGIQRLGGPHRDCQDFIDWLKETNGGDMPEANIKPFLSTPGYTPTQDEIDDHIILLLQGFQQNNIQPRRLYFYFSGHGIGVTQLNSALLLPKWSFMGRNYALSSEQYLLEFTRLGVFSEIFFFMDCCRNRVAGVQGRQPSWAVPVPSSNPVEYLLYYASEFDTFAYELTLPEEKQLNNALPRGLFTKTILTGLRGAAADRDGKLHVQDLVNYVKRKLPELAKANGKTQFGKPRIEIDLEKELTNPFPKEFPVSIRFNTGGMDMVLEGPDTIPVKTGNSNDGSWTIVLKRGKHLLRKAVETEGMKIDIDGTQLNFVYG